MTPERLRNAQRFMKKHRASRPGPKPAITKTTQPIDDEQAILMAIILLRRGKSAALVAIDRNVRLPIERVRQFESLLKQAGLLHQHDSDG